MMDPEKKKWSVIYPVYVNSKKTAADGRKIAKVKACENPTAQEIYDVCKHLGFKCELEADKAFPRDFMQKGRVRVLVQENKQSVHPDIHTKAALMVKLGELIPRLQSRQGGGAAASGAAAAGGKGGKRDKRKGR
ncbi:signal recognition particle 19 kDa protein [Acanthamoeba castellanii str. Neff]|uniref:Signal recognition particle 19 kDa protein n=1 Tax=Acanthamoeba castellanii (strain ATCC 30010 / Neff) TaxID=1257118 RepID=L8H4C6_ACACF|nr:signal recognition particle 19 kDa protein [Acanthamoeba castellanii str. Neff]ELR20030.1 signal recognition particle 19 kDa protein [Acanthamoeba castellanii str. Neff]